MVLRPDELRRHRFQNTVQSALLVTGLTALTGVLAYLLGGVQRSLSWLNHAAVQDVHAVLPSIVMVYHGGHFLPYEV